MRDVRDFRGEPRELVKIDGLVEIDVPVKLNGHKVFINKKDFPEQEPLIKDLVAIVIPKDFYQMLYFDLLSGNRSIYTVDQYVRHVLRERMEEIEKAQSIMEEGQQILKKLGIW